MSLADLWRVTRQRGWIVVTLMVLCAASAWAFSRLQTPIYESTLQILVQPARPDFGLSQTAKSFLRSYVAWLNTGDNAQRVIDQLQLDRAPESLLGDVTIASDDSRFTIQIDVRNPNGDLANDIARVWGDLFVQWRNTENAKLRQEDRVTALPLDAPRYTLYRPQTAVNVLAGALIGLVLGGLVVFVLEFLEANILRTRADVERGLNLPVLGELNNS